jgi:fatty-acyl-CoA synthase
MAMNLWSALTAEDRPTPTRSLHCWVGDRFEQHLWRDVIADAEQMTAGLRRAGARDGAVVATVLTNTPHVVRGLLGAWLSGAVVASLPLPARGMDASEYEKQILGLCDRIDPALLAVDSEMLALIPEPVRERLSVHSWESFAGTGKAPFAPAAEDQPAFIQYSSGSTSTPKGCVLTPRAIADQVELIVDMMSATPGVDAGASWLPLSHDMGLCSLLTGWANDSDFAMSTPQRFLFAPQTWFGDVAEFGASITVGTNTALHLATRPYRSRPLPGRLDRVGVCIIGAERVNWDTLMAAAEVFGPHGFRREALMPAYGMAEATLAVAATPVDEAPRRLAVDVAALADHEVREVDPDAPEATSIVSCGPPIRGVRLGGMESDRLNEIRVSSPSLACGYFRDPELTRERFVDGEFVTGDLGFLRDGSLYPVGRTDDLISYNGRNVYAREIEVAVDALQGVRTGCSTIVDGTDGRVQQLILLAELKDGTNGHYREVAGEAASLALRRAGVRLDRCVFLPKGALPKTPTGKIQRHRCREMFDSRRLEPIATVDLGDG